MNRRAWPALVVLALIVIGWFPASRAAMMDGLALLGSGRLGEFQQYLTSLGVWGPVASGLLMVLLSIAIPVPATILMIANGLAFGVWIGMLVSFVGTLGGAVGAYVIGRTLGRAVAEQLLPAASLDVADRFMERRGDWAIVLGHWVPGVPCDPVSYVAGMVRLPFVPFVLLTTIGLLPADFAAAFLGAESAAIDVGPWVWLGVGAVAVGGWLAWRLRRRRRDGRSVAAT
jgi:uncharacterized membrane protein YdjX (TVP38/TMEM64 family)